MKKKILLIDPYFNDGLNGFPLGLAYIAGALKKDYDVRALDLTALVNIERLDYETILRREVMDFDPDLAGITSTSPSHLTAIDAAWITKETKNIPIIKGGPHETVCGEETVRTNLPIDYSVMGEGEETIVELADAILNSGSVDGILGIAYFGNGNVVKTGQRQPISDIDNLPLPARELFYLDSRFDRYYSASVFGRRKATTVATSRGCPYSCSFCSAKANWGGLRQRSVDNVMDELKMLRSLGYSGFMFEDDMSIADKGWFLGFAGRISTELPGIQYTLQTRVDRVDDDIARALSESGCRMLYFGIESGVQEILDRCNKGITVGDAKEAYSVLRKHHVQSMASIQFGLPGEDLENYTTVRETIRVLNEELSPDLVAVSYTSLYPGSPISISAGVGAFHYEHYMKTRADEQIHDKTAHGTYAIHPAGLTDQKIGEIEDILNRELKIVRFRPGLFYNV